MRVMTWNLWWRFGDWERRLEAITTVIGDVDPDVVCLQEVWIDGHRDAATEIGDALGMHVTTGSSIGRGAVRFANAVLSRWPAEPLADEALPGRDDEPGHRRLVAAMVASPWGRWPIVSTHLDHRFDDSCVRERQALRLLEVAAALRGDPERDLPVVVGADLNATPDSDEIRLLTGRRTGHAGIVFSDAWEQTGDGAGWTWCRSNAHVADSAWPNRRLDYVLVSWPRPKPAGNPLRTRCVATAPITVGERAVWASDHAAVVAELVTP